ncbi:MAG: hypothetical protein ACREKE_08655, partial [bacterium]
MKKFILLFGVLAASLLAALGLRKSAGIVGLALFAWLATETRGRARFRFSVGPARERVLDLPAEAVDLRCGGEALFVHADGRLSLAHSASGRVRSLALEHPALAVLPLEQGRFLAAFEDRLSLRDAQGR